eukprot:CAMPEP_0185796282 /NCGR_PEP_ID=MMETSP1174-20130828/161000_1 /TAXON_ID=35687 /ORGANISM="Dictyocha speculum, Strain CCMP1381" /LENGTH=94 /DNA_ID=CAMNT_0028491633 /DNA_START=654 /DNA_END=935 /DNA_ORIENTATION=-
MTMSGLPRMFESRTMMAGIPMLLASISGRLEVCRWFHEPEATKDIRIADNDERTSMSMAFQRGHLEVWRWFFRMVDSTETMAMFEKPLQLAKKL